MIDGDYGHSVTSRQNPMPPCKFSDCKETYYVNTFRCVVMVRHWYFRGTRVYQPRNLFVLWISVQEIRW